MPATRFIVGGRVQGVFFRASTREQAQRLGLRGHARNLADGDVEVVAIGAPDTIAGLARWLRHGPPTARVESLRTEQIDEPGGVDAFTIG